MQGIWGKRCNFQKLTTQRQAFSIIACRRVYSRESRNWTLLPGEGMKSRSFKWWKGRLSFLYLTNNEIIKFLLVREREGEREPLKRWYLPWRSTTNLIWQHDQNVSHHFGNRLLPVNKYTLLSPSQLKKSIKHIKETLCFSVQKW